MKKQWQHFKLLVVIYGLVKTQSEKIESWLKATLGATEMWRIAAGATGTRNGFPCILETAKEFEIQLQGPLGRYGYRDTNGDLYVFHKKHIERHGTVVVICNHRLWVSN